MNKEKRRIISAGHICLDITPVFNSSSDYSEISELLVPGSLSHVGPANIHTGGSVSNTGLALKKLGADVKLLGKVGNDKFGKLVISILNGYGVDGIIIDPDSSTSYSIVLAIPGLDRIFLHNPGANDSFCSDDIPDSAFDDAELFHFGYPPLMRKMYDNDGEELIKLFKHVKAKNLLTSLDMAAISAGSDVSLVNWRLILRNLLPYVDYFLPSFEEIAFMLGYDSYDINNIDMNKDVKPLADELITMGASVVVIKCGEAGLYYTSDSESGIQRAFKAEKICSATGAGDTCIAAFLMAVMDGRNISESVKIAAAEGACSVTTYDALSGLLPICDLEKKIESGWDTI